MAFLGLATSRELSGTAGVASSNASRISALEGAGVTKEIFKGINESILAINRNLINIQEAITADSALQKQQARDQAADAKEKLDLQKKERAESFLELDAKKNLLKPVEKATEGVKSVFERFFDALGALVGGWFIDKFGDLYEGWKDGDKEKLEEAAGQIKAGLGILAGVFVAQQVGTVLLSTAMGGLMGAITGGAGLKSVIGLLGNPVAWLAIGAVITAIAVWARNREVSKNRNQKLEQLLIMEELTNPGGNTDVGRDILRDKVSDENKVAGALVASESGINSETDIAINPSSSAETNVLGVGNMQATSSLDNFAWFLMEQNLRKSIKVDGKLFDDSQWKEFPAMIEKGIISVEEAVLHMAIKEGMYSFPSVAYVARYYQELNKWVQINDRIKELNAKLGSAEGDDKVKIETELASLKVILDQTNNTIVALEDNAEGGVKNFLLAANDLAVKELGLDPAAAKALDEAGGDRKKMLEILTRFGTADYFSEQTGGIISNKQGFTSGWMDRPLSVHNNEMYINQKKPLFGLSSAFDYGGDKINVGLDNLDNWVKVMKDINQEASDYLPEGVSGNFVPYSGTKVSPTFSGNKDLSSYFNTDLSLDGMPKFEFVYPENIGSFTENSDLYTGTLSEIPNLWTINLEDGLGTYYSTEYGVD